MKLLLSYFVILVFVLGRCESYDIRSIHIHTDEPYKIKINSSINTSGYKTTVKLIPQDSTGSQDLPEKSDTRQKFSFTFQNIRGTYKVIVTIQDLATGRPLFSLPFLVTVHNELPPPVKVLNIIHQGDSSFYIQWNSDPRLNILRYILCYYANKINEMLCARISGKLHSYYPMGLDKNEAYTFFIAQENRNGTSSFIGRIKSRRLRSDADSDNFKKQLSFGIDVKFNSFVAKWTLPSRFSIVESYILLQAYDTSLTTPVLNYCIVVYKLRLHILLSKIINPNLNQTVIDFMCADKDINYFNHYFGYNQVNLQITVGSLESDTKYKLTMVNLLRNGKIYNDSRIISTTPINCQYDCWDIKNYRGSNQKLYLGKQFITNDGIECQNWHSSRPHSPNPVTVASLRPNARNFCRMPPKDPFSQPWCYTTDPSKVWTVCDVQQCSALKGERICPSKFELKSIGKALTVTWLKDDRANGPHVVPNFYVIEIVRERDETSKCVDLVEYKCSNCDSQPLDGMFEKNFEQKIIDCGRSPKRSVFNKNSKVYIYSHQLTDGPGSNYRVTIYISNNKATGIKAQITQDMTIPYQMSGPPQSVIVHQDNRNIPQLIWSPPENQLSDLMSYLVLALNEKDHCQEAYQWTCSDCSINKVESQYDNSFLRDKRNILEGCPQVISKTYSNTVFTFRQELFHVNVSKEFEIRIFPISSIGFGKESLYKKGIVDEPAKKDKPAPSKSSAGLIVGILFLILLCLVGAFVYKKYLHDKPCILRTQDFRRSFKKVNVPSQSETTVELQPSEPIKEPQAVSVNALHRRLDRMKREDRLNQEFKLLNEMSSERENTLKLTTNTAQLPENIAKNRYKSMVPFDQSRVKLPIPKRVSERIDGDEASDYINASFITGFSGGKDYIASQGPLENTVRDFWEMIWSYEINIMVILTRTETDRKFKCDAYWPELNETNKEFLLSDRAAMLKVKTIEQTHSETFVIRVFEVASETLKRKVIQLHLLTWDDHGTPNPGDFFTFWKKVDEMQTNQNHSAPLLVHCSAGVGRTGTFICIDYLLQSLKSGNTMIDIFHTILKMREERRKFVQKDVQYQFIHEFMVYLNEKDEIKTIAQTSVTSQKKSMESNLAYGSMIDDVFEPGELTIDEDPPQAMAPPIVPAREPKIKDDYCDASAVSPAVNFYERLNSDGGNRNSNKTSSERREGETYDSLWNKTG